MPFTFGINEAKLAPICHREDAIFLKPVISKAELTEEDGLPLVKSDKSFTVDDIQDLIDALKRAEFFSS